MNSNRREDNSLSRLIAKCVLCLFSGIGVGGASIILASGTIQAMIMSFFGILIVAFALMYLD